VKQLSKQSMRELIKFALEMPVEDLEKYRTVFTGTLPDKMTRGELIALQLIERASFGDLDAVKELRYWVVEDPKAPGAGGTNYYQFLIQLSQGVPVSTPLPPDAAEGLRKMVTAIEIKAEEPPANDLLDDLA